MSDILKYRTEWYSQVRVRLLGSDNTNIISDDTLDYYADLAERLIKTRVPTWSAIITNGGDNKEYLIDATVSQLGAIFVTPLRNLIPTNKRVADIAVQKKIDFDKMETDLIGEIDMFLNMISTLTPLTVKRVGVITNTPIYEDLEE
jgi:hypothetical protein